MCIRDRHKQGHTVVLITHDNSIAVQADRIIRLEDGQVVYDLSLIHIFWMTLKGLGSLSLLAA